MKDRDDLALFATVAGGPVCLRLSGGIWSALDLADRVLACRKPGAAWISAFARPEPMRELARREIDIGLHKARETGPSLA